MLMNDIDYISENVIIEVLNALNHELSNGRNNDHNLFTLFYLITVISHVCYFLLQLQSFFCFLN